MGSAWSLGLKPASLDFISEKRPGLHGTIFTPCRADCGQCLLIFCMLEYLAVGTEANKLVLTGRRRPLWLERGLWNQAPLADLVRFLPCVQLPHLQGGLRSPLSLGVSARIERGVRPWSAARLVVSTQQEEWLRGSACPPPSYPPSQPTPLAQPCSPS